MRTFFANEVESNCNKQEGLLFSSINIWIFFSGFLLLFDVIFLQDSEEETLCQLYGVRPPGTLRSQAISHYFCPSSCFTSQITTLEVSLILSWTQTLLLSDENYHSNLETGTFFFQALHFLPTFLLWSRLTWNIVLHSDASLPPCYASILSK